MFQPEMGYMTWPQGRVFYDSYRFWNQTSGHVDQMFTREWLPWVLDVDQPSDSLDILVKASEEGDNPDLISPVSTTKKVRRKFSHEFPGYSFTVIRLKHN